MECEGQLCKEECAWEGVCVVAVARGNGCGCGEDVVAA